MFGIQSPETWQVKETGLSNKQMQAPNGTGPGVQRSKRPLLTSRVVANDLWKSRIACLKCDKYIVVYMFNRQRKIISPFKLNQY